MRISTNQMYNAGLRGMERPQSQLVRLQSQLASGQRMLTAADDPVAAARALNVRQAMENAAQYASNQGTASDRLSFVDSQLGALTDVLQSVRSAMLQAGNTAIADADRQAIAVQLEARLEDALAIANSRDPEGNYLFSGARADTRPFARNPAGAAQAFAYLGDDGERSLQVSSTQQMATNVSGRDLFMNIREGNGTFSATASGNGGLPNQGSGVLQAETVVDQQKWLAAVNGGFPWQGTSNQVLQIRFSAPGGVSSYQIFDASTSSPPAAPLAPVAVSAVLPFTPGQAIPLLTSAQPPAAPASTDFGAQVVIAGAPGSGDTFTVKPSGNKSMFETMLQAVELLRTPLANGAERTQFSARLQTHLGNLDQALGNVTRVHSTVGAHMQQLDLLLENSSARNLQYQQTLSNLEDLDYAQALSDVARQQLSLEAAQKSFAQVSGLSLFRYL